MKKILLLMFIIVVLLNSSIFALAIETSNGEDVQVAGGLDLGQLLNLGSGILAFILFVLTFTAYNRSKNSRLIYVSFAFLLFSINGFITASQLFFGDWAWIDPITNILNFAILLSFFIGIIKE